MNKLLVILTTIFIYTSSFAQNILSPVETEELITRIAETNKAHKTIICDFIQKKHIYVLDHDIISSGKYYYQKDDNMCMLYDNPKGNVMLMNSDVLLIIENNKRSLLKKDATPFAKQMRKMLTACMCGDIAHIGLSSRSRIEASDHKTYYEINIKSNKNSYILNFNHNDLTLKTLRFDSDNGDFTEYNFKNVSLNKEINQSIFNHSKY